MKTKNLLIVFACFIVISSHAQNLINVMPYPQHVGLKSGDLVLQNTLSISLEGKRSEFVSKAMERFIKKYRQASSHPIKVVTAKEGKANINIKKVSKKELGISNNEGYTIEIEKSIIIKANTEEGILHALETLSQLATYSEEGMHFKKLSIQDWPSYPWRGMMVDVARHFIPMDMMKRNVDAMAAVKYNILHIHISDDEGFRIESKKYPGLHLNGSNGKYYTQKEMIEFVQYCKDRGIKVYAEFDLPGHSQSWFAGYPELAAEKRTYQPGPRFKIDGNKPVNLMTLMQMVNNTPTPSLDVSIEQTYQFLDNLIKEMKPLFSMAYMHMGLDENNGVAWKKNPQIATFMKEKGMQTTHELQNYFAEKFSTIIEKNGMTPIAWEEAFHKGLNKNIAIQIWKSAMMGPAISVDSISANGNDVIMSRGFYLDVFMPAYYHFLNVDILNDNNKLVGGEAAIWTEMVDETNFENRVWPRAAVIAERLWSSNKLNEVEAMYERLNVVNHQLAENGLQQIKSSEKLLSNLTNGQMNAASKTFFTLITPIKGYKKLMGLMTKPSIALPLKFDQLSDIIPVDATGKWAFRQQVKTYLKSPTEENLLAVKKTLIEWSTLNKGVAAIRALNIVQEHANNLSEISLNLLQYLNDKDENLKGSLLKKINAARAPKNEVELVVFDELEALLTGNFKALEMNVPMF